MTTVELTLMKTEEEYREKYKEIYLHSELHLEGIPVVFSERDFDHIFYEPASGSNGYKFSFRRARRMRFIESVLSGKLNIEIMFEPDRATVALFCMDLECVIYLRIRPGSGALQVGTFFDFGRDHTRMYKKQMKKCELITVQGIKEKMKHA